MNSTSTGTSRQTAKWVYPLLLAVQTVGAGILVRSAVPLYRTLAGDASQYELNDTIFVWTMVAVAMMQAAYWIGQRIGPPSWHGQVLLGHLVKFLGRVSYTATTAIFSLVFIRRPEDVQLPFSRLLGMVVGVFSMFCYNLELDKVGTALQKPRANPGKDRQP